MTAYKFTQHELNQALDVATNSTSKLSPIWTASWERVKSIKSLYGDFYLGDDAWCVDEKYLASKRASLSNRTLNFKRINDSDYDDNEGVTRRFKRLAWIYLHSGSGETVTKIKSLQNLQNLIVEMEPIVHLQLHDLDDECPDGPKLFANIIASDYEQKIPMKSMRDGVNALNYLMNDIDDLLRFKPKTYVQHRLNSSGSKNDNIVGLPAYEDAEITSILKQALYFSNLTQLVVDFERWAEPHRKNALNDETRERGGVFYLNPSKSKYPEFAVYRSKRAKQLYEEEFHSDYKNTLIEAGYLRDNGDFIYPFGTNLIYTNFDGYTPIVNQALLGVIEISHRLLIAFFTGMRDQELYALKSDCIRELNGEDYSKIIGYDLKGSDTLGGDERDWPLPNTCLSVIQNQKLLNEQFFASEETLFNVGYHGKEALQSFALAINLSPDWMLKRMRPTIASLVMLASRSPLAVKAVLGHSEFEQTMGYAKSRKTLQQDLIAQDSRVNKALGSKIFDAVKTGNAPVKLATNVLETSARFVGNDKLAKKARSIVDKYEIDDFAELLELFGDNLDSVEEHLGEQFDFVNSFTLCGAKRSDFNGACSAIPGVKNPSNCKSNCKYRQDLHQNLNYRAKQVEMLIEDIADFEPDEPSYYQRVNQLLDFVWGFEGPLEKYKSDLRIQSIVYALDDSDEGSEVRKKLAPNARQALAQITGEAA